MNFAEVENRELKSYEHEIKRKGLDVFEEEQRQLLMNSSGQKCENAKWLICQFQEGFGKENLEKAIEILQGIL